MQRSFHQLSAREILAFAIAIERRNAARYHEWALRFRPWDPSVARVLGQMAEEEQSHETELLAVWRLHHAGEPEAMVLADIDARLEDVAEPSAHFFVTGEGAARGILRQALDAERAASHFYERALVVAQDPAVRDVLALLARFEATHVAVIEERLVEMGHG